MWVLEKNSFYGRFWQWSYKGSDLPKSFCPFFWSFLIAIPLSPITLLSRLAYSIAVKIDHYLIDRYNDKFINEPEWVQDMRSKNYNFEKDDTWGKHLSLMFLISIVLIILLFILCIFINFFIGLFTGNLNADSIAAAITVFGTITLIILIITFANGKFNKYLQNTTNLFGMLWSMIKGLGKYCPRIEWK